MSSMKDYIDCIPFNVKHKIVPIKKTRVLRVNTFRENSVVPISFTNGKFDVSNGVPRKILRNFRIQRKIDLHGLTQEEAFRAIHLFLARCQQEGVKTALVITGGNAMKVSVIRTSFKKWISDNFSSFVSSYSQAKLKDGGQGAFYVVIRRKL